MHVNKVVVPIFRLRKFVPAAEGAVGRVDCDGQEVFHDADRDIAKIYWSHGLDFEAGLITAEMVLAHREVEVCCVVCTLTVDVGCLSKAKRISLRSVCVSCLEYQSAKSSGSPAVM